MSDSKTTIKTGLVVEQSGTLTPNAIELAPGGAASTKTVLQGSQTADRTITTPDASTTMVGTDVAQTLINKTIVAADNTVTVAATGVVSTSLNGALTEIQANVAAAGSGASAALNAHINNTTGAHAASAISVTPSGNLASTQVQAALVELQGDIDTNATNISTNATNLSNHITNPTGAHAASAISVTPSGNLAATEAQAALVELQLDVDTRATTAALTAHTGASTGVHGVTGAVVGTTDTQTLTNKSIGSTGLTFNQIATPATPVAGTNKIYPKADGNFYTLNSSGVEVQIGSGSSGGLYPNFISNGSADNSTTGWTTYTNTAGTSPVTGSGAGATNITFTTTTTNPLSGTTSFLITKAAVNAQGQGVSYDFEVDLASQAKPLKVSFDYKLVSGTFAAGNPADRTSAGDSTLTVWLFDLNNNTLIQPSNYRLYSNSSTSPSTFEGEFQTSTNGTIYRLIIHNGSTSAAAYSLELDTVAVRRSQTVTGATITDPVDYTLVVGAVTTAPTQGAGATKKTTWRREGKYMVIDFNYAQTAAGTAGSGTYLFPLPAGYSIDTTIISTTTLSNGASSNIVGHGRVHNTTAGATTASVPVSVFPYSATTLFLVDQTASPQQGSPIGSAEFGMNNNPYYISFTARVPIQGWSASTLMSDSADTRVVDFSGYVQTNQALTATVTNMNLTATKDSHGAWTGSTFVVPVSGDYLVTNTIAFSAVVSTSVRVHVDGTFIKETGASFNAQRSSGSAILTDLRAGQIVSFRTGDNVTTLSGTAYNISIYRLSGPAQISATELIAARYSSSAGQTINTTSTQLSFATRAIDTHGAFNGTIFTAPASGKYRVYAKLFTVNTTTINSVDLEVWKNGVVYSNLGRGPKETTVSSRIVVNGMDLIQLNAGDTLEIRGQSGVGTIALINDGVYVYAIFERVGI